MGSVVTVAELMRRCTPAPEVEDDDAAPIPVSALLRREGRSAAGLPVQPPAVGEILATLPARQPLLRRGAMAAGALLAAGSVFGLTAAMNAPFTPPTSSGTFPDQGEPSGPGSPTVLDAGQAAPSTWLPVAFPTLFPEANAPAPQAAAPRVAQPVAAQAPAANSGGTARQASSGGSPRRRTRAAPRPRRRTAAASWAARSTRSAAPCAKSARTPRSRTSPTGSATRSPASAVKWALSPTRSRTPSPRR